MNQSVLVNQFINLKKTYSGLLYFVFILATLFPQTLLAQDDTRLIFKKYYAQAIEAIEQKKYAEAENLFKKIGRLDITFPDDLAYFYGYTQLNLGKYVQAKAAFEKYLTLRTDTGRYAGFANHYLHLADCNIKGHYFETTTCDQCHGKGKSETQCRTCKGKGTEVCNICFGRGVLKTQDNFGEKFETCKKCVGTGYYTCSKCQGKSNELDKCLICDGKGFFSIRKECNLLEHKE